jgi:catechol 2,3-dioxygenase-like lactoylglutathione lyase family enzyme
MSSTEVRNTEADGSASPGTVDMKLEVVVIPVSDADRAKDFYTDLGWRLDADVTVADDMRVVQFTPPGSGCSIQFGVNVTPSPPGSAQNLYLVVSDIEAARNALLARGIEVSGTFHEGSLGDRFGTQSRARGPAPDHATYSSFASFSDPDGNVWLFQEITTRLPGRIDSDETEFASIEDLASALRRADAAHGEHEKRARERDDDWPDWYAAYMIAEQSGAEPPT